MTIGVGKSYYDESVSQCYPYHATNANISAKVPMSSAMKDLGFIKLPYLIVKNLLNNFIVHYI